MAAGWGEELRERRNRGGKGEEKSWRKVEQKLLWSVARGQF
jgi:hypothetical protein